MQRGSNRRVSAGFLVVAGLALALTPACRMPWRSDNFDDNGTANGFALNTSGDLTELSLEDLMEVDFSLPVTVLGAHTHNAGTFMIGLTTGVMGMHGSRDGSSRISNAEILETYDTVHTGMLTRMTMLSAMYAPSDDTTLMVMVPRIHKEARHVEIDGTKFTRTSHGIGDVQVHALHTIYREDEHRMHVDAGVSLPTGSIDIATMGQREHYMQQLGSGTVDLMPGITYLGESEQWSWGTQANSVVRLGKNKHDYALGNRYGLTTWINRRIAENLAVSLRLNGQTWGDVRGADGSLDVTAIAENDPDNQGGRRVDALVGLSYYGTEGALEGHRIEAEAGVPIYQKLNGPQMEMDYVATLSWKITF